MMGLIFFYYAIGVGVFGYVWDELNPEKWQIAIVFLFAATWPLWIVTWFVYHTMKRIRYDG